MCVVVCATKVTVVTHAPSLRLNKDILTARAVANGNINIVAPYPSALFTIVPQLIADIIDFATTLRPR